MGQILTRDKLSIPTLLSANIITLAGLNVVSAMGQLLVMTNPQIDVTTNGLGGLDTGSIAARTNYNLFAVRSGGVSGLVASAVNAPLGFPLYRRVGGFFTDDTPAISYALDETGSNSIVMGDTGSVTGGGSWTSNEYGATGVNALMGSGLWELFGSVASGNTGVGPQIIFQQLIFGDTDGANTVSQPVGTELNTYLVSGNGRSFVFGQATNGARFNSVGNEAMITLNIPNNYRCFAVGRQQSNNPVSAVMSVSLTATRIDNPII